MNSKELKRFLLTPASWFPNETHKTADFHPVDFKRNSLKLFKPHWKLYKLFFHTCTSEGDLPTTLQGNKQYSIPNLLNTQEPNEDSKAEISGTKRFNRQCSSDQCGKFTTRVCEDLIGLEMLHSIAPVTENSELLDHEAEDQTADKIVESHRKKKKAKSDAITSNTSTKQVDHKSRQLCYKNPYRGYEIEHSEYDIENSNHEEGTDHHSHKNV